MNKPPTDRQQDALAEAKLQNVFSFWRLIEALSPEKADSPKPKDETRPIYDAARGLPWEDKHQHQQKHLPQGLVWRYTAQCGVHDIKAVADRLTERIGWSEEAQFDERVRTGKTRAFDLSFDENGLPIPESLVLSLGFWLTGQILKYGEEALKEGFEGYIDLKDLPGGAEVSVRPSGFAAFDELTRRLIAYLVHERARLVQEKRSADLTWLVAFCQLVADKCYLPEIVADLPIVWVKCTQIRRPKPTRDTEKEKETAKGEEVVEAKTDDLLNSFFITDLSLVHSAWVSQNVGKALCDYMGGVANSPERLDVRTSCGLKFAFQGLAPEQMPAGCWPSDHALAFSQQLAVNEIWRRLASGSGLFSINGPPGTGKTTLLRDIVAAVVVDRALKIAGLLRQRCDKVFRGRKPLSLGRESHSCYWALPQELTATAIVVASANNGAVENVTLELPGKKSVPGRIEVDFYRDLATKLLGSPAWSLISAPLGKKDNCRKFLETFWWYEPQEKKGQYELRPAGIAQAGMQWRLKAIWKKKLVPHLALDKALENFEQALANEQRLRAERTHYAALLGQIETVREELARIEHKLTAAGSKIERVSSMRRARLKLDSLRQDLDRHIAVKPGFWERLLTLGKTMQSWRRQYEQLQDQLAVAREELEEAQRNADLAARAELLNAELERLVQEQQQAMAYLGDHWPRQDAAEEERELSSPWMDAEWRLAREQLFLTALELHRAFVERYARQMQANLNIAVYWLQGRTLPEEAARVALDSLALIVPVISTTFASVASMFCDLGRESIGWLLIDEAGQAPPQQAVGAIWRSRRVIVVGDPLQLEPIVTVPSSVERVLAQHRGVDRLWWPSATSVQRLADAANDLGTWLPGAESQEEVWVGCPLRVHRRCADPMFTVSNRIAYDGMMIQGKAGARGQAYWYHLESTENEGHWIPVEGEKLREIVYALITEGLQPRELFLLSPFRDCADRLRHIARELGLDSKRCGTVHTAQGKQAKTVILVLGGDPKRPGAKDWAASKPNLLNVAVTRAEERFIVIGNREEWRRRRFFDVLDRQIG